MIISRALMSGASDKKRKAVEVRRRMRKRKRL